MEGFWLWFCEGQVGDEEDEEARALMAEGRAATAMRDSEILSGRTFSNSPSSVDGRVCAVLPAPRLWLLTLEVPSAPEDGGIEEKEDIEW